MIFHILSQQPVIKIPVIEDHPVTLCGESVGFCIEGVSAIEYHYKDQPFDLQSMTAAVWPGFKFSVVCKFSHG